MARIYYCPEARIYDCPEAWIHDFPRRGAPLGPRFLWGSKGVPGLQARGGPIQYYGFILKGHKSEKMDERTQG